MTKFEEDLNKKMNLKEVPMYFTQSGCSITRKTYIETNWIFDNYKNWHSDEEFQEHFIANTNLIDVNTKLAEEIANLKFQLQQQALPVVPEFVAEWIECVKGKNNNALALLDDDNMPDDVNEWLLFQRNDDNINLILRAWLDGYQVEKPQLFYLKHIDFCKTDKHYDWFTIKHSDGPLNHLRVEKGQKPSTIDCKFTQQEIDSMHADSYEKIEASE